MSSPLLNGSVTFWLEQLKAGEAAAAASLWNGYYSRLVAVARGRMRSSRSVAVDEEDVALSAFDSFCRGVEVGRFPRLDDRHDLWKVLLVITTRKAVGCIRKEQRAKRGGGRVALASTIDAGAGSTPDFLGGVAGMEPSPAFAAEVADECRRLLSILDDGELRQLAIWKMEGFKNAEIAIKMGKSVPTVERKLARIRTMWERESPS